MTDEETLPDGTVIDEDEEEEIPQAAPIPQVQWKDIRNRRGFFMLSVDFLENHAEQVMNLFSKIIVLKASTEIEGWTIIYQVVSPLFDEIKPGTDIPWYCIYAKADMSLAAVRMIPIPLDTQEEEELIG